MKRGLLYVLIFLIQQSAYSQGHTCKTDYFPFQNPKNRMWGYMNLLGEWSVLAQYTKTYPFRGKIAVVQKGLKFGAINCNLKNVIPFNYDEIKPFVGTSGWVRKSDYWGLINDSGKVLLQPVYSDIKELNHYSSEVWVKDKLGLWGLYSKYDSKWLCTPQYSEVRVLNEKFSVIKINNKKGFIDNESGLFKIEPTLDSIVKVAPYVSAVKRDNKWGVVNDQGEYVVPIEFFRIKGYSSTRLVVTSDDQEYLINSRSGRRSSKKYNQIFPLSGGASLVELDGKYGYINIRGYEIVDLVYMDGDDFESLRAVVVDSLGCFLIDNKGSKVLNDSLRYAAIHRLNKSTSFMLDDYGEYTLVNPDGELKNDSIIDFLDSKRFLRVFTTEKKWRYLDLDTYDVDLYGFDSIQSYTSPFSVGNNDGCNYVFKPFKSESKSECYEKVQTLGINGIYIVSLNSDKNAIWNNEVLTTKTYDNLVYGSKRIFYYLHKKKWGMISSKGNIITEPIFESINTVSGDLFFAKGKKSVLALRSNGKAFFENKEIDSILDYREGYFVVEKGGEYFLMNRGGKFNFKSGYDELSSLYNGKCAVKKNGKWGIINKKGSVLIAPQYSSYSIINGEVTLH